MDSKILLTLLMLGERGNTDQFILNYTMLGDGGNVDSLILIYTANAGRWEKCGLSHTNLHC